MSGGPLADLERSIELARQALDHLLTQRGAVTRLDPEALASSTAAQAALLEELAGCLGRCRPVLAALPPSHPHGRALASALRQLQILARLNGALIGDATTALAPLFGRDPRGAIYDRRARQVTAPPAPRGTVL